MIFLGIFFRHLTQQNIQQLIMNATIHGNHGIMLIRNMWSKTSVVRHGSRGLRNYRFFQTEAINELHPMPPALQELEIEKEHEIDKIWSKSAAAMNILKQGNSPSDLLHSRNFKDYLKARGFAAALDDESALRTLSSVMTFPLTLGYACSLIFRGFPRRETKILILGARAESSLPDVWWKEYLYLNDRVASTVIRMNGPGVQPQKHASTTASSNGDNTITKTTHVTNGSTNTQLPWKNFQPTNVPDLSQVLEDWGVGAVPSVTIHHEFNPESVKLLHDRADAAELLQWADLFVMFNPGVGSEPCKTQWDPTIRLLMQTRKPILFTAFNEVDLDKDLAALDRISAEEDTQDFGEPLELLFAPHENPFQSLRRTIDKKAEEGSEGRIVRANQFLYALQSK